MTRAPPPPPHAAADHHQGGEGRLPPRARRHRPPAGARALHGLAVLATCSAPALCAAADLGARLQVGASHGVTVPQRTRFGLGPDLRLAALWRASEAFEARAGLGAGLWPSSEEAGDGRPSALLSVGAGGRLRMPLTPARRAFLWMEAGASYARSGPLDGLGLDVAAGASFDLLPSRALLFGPALRLDAVLPLGVEAARLAAPTALASLGLELELRFGTLHDAGRPTGAHDGAPGSRPHDEASPQTSPSRPPTAGGRKDCRGAAAAGSPACIEGEGKGDGKGPGGGDADGDGVPDTTDRCPAKPGATADRGCPATPTFEIIESDIVVRRGVRFAVGTSRLSPEASAAVLETAELLAANPDVCVTLAARPGPAALTRARVALIAALLRSRGVLAARVSTSALPPSGEPPPPGDVAILRSPCQPLR